MIIATALRDLHIVNGWFVVFANAGAGIWAFSAHHRPALRRRELWWLTLVAQVLVFVQAGIGVGMQSAENLEPDDFHYLYGFTMLVVVGILYSYRQQMPDKQYLLYAGGSLFLMGLAIRGLLLGGAQ